MSDEILDSLGTQQVLETQESQDTGVLEAHETTKETPVSETPVSETQAEETPASETEDTTTEEVPEAPVSEAQVPEPRMTEREFNIREMRKSKENAERETLEARKRIAELEARIPKEEELQVDAEDFVEGKHLTRMQNRVKKIEEENKRIREIQELSSQYPDYNSVMTQDAIARLEATEPELAASLAAASQGSGWKSAAAATFKLIKKMNLGKSYERERNLAAKNVAKPRSVSTLSPQHGKSPIAMAKGLSEMDYQAEKEATYLDALAKAKMID